MILVAKSHDYDIIINHAQQILLNKQKNLEMLHRGLDPTINSYQL